MHLLCLPPIKSAIPHLTDSVPRAAAWDPAAVGRFRTAHLTCLCSSADFLSSWMMQTLESFTHHGGRAKSAAQPAHARAGRLLLAVVRRSEARGKSMGAQHNPGVSVCDFFLDYLDHF